MLPSGGQVATFGIATNRVYKDRTGARQEATEFHNIVAFGRPAELIGQYMKKGRSIFVEGRLQTRNWDDRDTGKKMYRTEIVVDNFQFISDGRGAGAGNGGGSFGGGAPVPRAGQPASAPAQENSEVPYPDEEINPADIPF